MPAEAGMRNPQLSRRYQTGQVGLVVRAHHVDRVDLAQGDVDRHLLGGVGAVVRVLQVVRRVRVVDMAALLVRVVGDVGVGGHVVRMRRVLEAGEDRLDQLLAGSTSVMWPQIVLRNSSFQYSIVRSVESGSGRPRKNSRSKTPSPSELATMKLATVRSSPAHCSRIVAGELYQWP